MITLSDHPLCKTSYLLSLLPSLLRHLVKFINVCTSAFWHKITNVFATFCHSLHFTKMTSVQVQYKVFHGPTYLPYLTPETGINDAANIRQITAAFDVLVHGQPKNLPNLLRGMCLKIGLENFAPV